MSSTSTGASPRTSRRIPAPRPTTASGGVKPAAADVHTCYRSAYNSLLHVLPGGPTARSAVLSTRLDPTLKQEAAALYASLDLSLTEAINVCLVRSLQVGGLPFELRQPRYSPRAEAAIAESEDIAAGKVTAPSYTSVDDLAHAILDA